MADKGKKSLGPGQREELLATLEARFRANLRRHEGLDWEKVRARLEGAPDKLWSLSEMERSGGEPDVTDRDKSTGEFIFSDCSPESPQGRRSVCYDGPAKTSSWLLTPPAIRDLGGAIFGDYRFGTIFVYHNGADSYYGARGFRCVLRV